MNFYHLLENHDLGSLYSRLDQLDDFNGDLPMQHHILPIEALPIELVIDEIRYEEEYSQYLTELLFWVVERTTPTKELIERFAYSADISAFKPLEELLKRYDGKVTLNTFGSYYLMKWIEVLLGYSLLDIETMVPWTVPGTDGGEVTVLPIEYVIIIYVLDHDTDAQYVAKLLCTYGSPNPNLEKIRRVFAGSQKRMKRLQKIINYLTKTLFYKM